MTEQLVVALESIGVSYGSGPRWRRTVTEALKSIDLTIAPGETVGLVGESGSGKSTLGHVIVGQIQPTAGTYRFCGGALTRHERRRGDLQAVFQHPDSSLNPRWRIATSIAEPLVRAGDLSRSQRRERVAEMLDKVGLDPVLADRLPHQLSGGQRQRVAVARALIHNPKFVLFDEVVTALDVSVQAQILNLIRELQAESGFASLFISHDLAVVRYVADRIAVLQDGVIVEDAPSERFYGTPDHPHSRELALALAQDGSHPTPTPVRTEP